VSRSLLAWTKSCAVGAARHWVASNQVQAHLGCERLVLTVSSLTPVISIVATFMVTLTLSPVALGKVGTPHSRPSTGTAHGGAPNMYAAITHNARKHHPSPGAARLAHGRDAGADVLVYGSGYRAPHGSLAVRAVQRRLASLGYRPGPIDGRYGPRTGAAVVRFQATHGLTADGIAGARTLAALAAAKPVLYPGEGYSPSGSDAVRSLQRHLAAAGFSPGPIDGRYGPSTERAVTQFQHARHLRTDGIAGPQTADHLQAVHSPPTHPRQAHVPSRRSAGRHQTRPAPVQPTGAPRQANPVPERTRQPGRHPAAFPLVWVIVLVGLLLAVLAGRLRRRRRGGDADAGARPVQPDGRDRLRAATPPTGTAADASDNTSVSMGVAEATGPGSSRPKAAHQEADQQEGAAAFRLGLLLAQEGERVGAEDAFRRADERGHADAAFELGVLLAHQGDNKGAKEAFRRAEKRGHPDAAFDLGALLVQEGDRAGAEEAFRRAAEHGDGGAASNLGVLLEQRGDLVGAKQAYQRADQRGHGVGAFNLGALLEEQGYLVAAKEAYQRADQRGDPDGANCLGLLLERAGDQSAAKEAFRRADQRGHPEGACNLGLLLKDEGDRAGAVGAFHRAGERSSPELVKVVRAALLELDPGEEDGQ
jgi:peptidoglycan hydrolase-like protein with peptidoglycan-binding domain/tetratricopeptide (TPR) repeat protein